MEYTYCSGPEFYSKNKHNLTKNDIYIICNSLKNKFGDGYSFKPEAITQGGIIMEEFPNKTINNFKTLRLGTIYGNRCNGEWPWIHQDLNIEEWKDNNDEIFINKTHNKKFLIPTFLKAFHGAPVWNKNELNKICEVFNELGFSYKKSTFPLNKKLKQIGSLGC